MYRYGLIVKRWHAGRHELVQAFMASLKADKDLFTDFFVPARGEFRDTLDWELRETLLSDGGDAVCTDRCRTIRNNPSSAAATARTTTAKG
jgi:hypothetical protein